MGRLWIFFLGGRGGKRKHRSGSAGSVAGRHTLSNSLIYVIYYMLSSGGFTAASGHRDGVLDPQCPESVRVLFKVWTTRRPVPHIQDSEGDTSPRSFTDSTEQWVGCFIHMWFMLHVISVIFLV